MSFEIVRSLPLDLWRGFVERHPYGNIFHTPQMFEVHRNTQGYQPGLWAARDNERVLALFLPVRIALTGGLLRLLTSRSVAFGGVLCEESPEGRAALQDLLRTYQRNEKGHSLFTEIRNLSDVNGIAALLAQAGFGYEDHLNYLIPLAPEPEHVLDQIGARTRKHIRRSLSRAEVDVEEVTDRAQVEICYELLCHAYRNAQVPLADISLFQAAFERLVPAGLARFTLARIGDRPAAASLDLLYKDVIFGWYGGVDRSLSAYVPNEILMWHVLEWGCRHGYRVYDFGGAGKPDEKYGVRDFKAKFGGELVCFGRNTWVTNRALMTLGRNGYSLLRRLLFA